MNQTRTRAVQLNTDQAPSHGIRALTGHDVNALTLDLYRHSSLASKISAALANGKVVTTAMAGLGINEGIIYGGLRASHIYTVVKYDATGDRIMLRNPWGFNPETNGHYIGEGFNETGYPTGNKGYFWLSFSKFKSCFIQVAIET